MCDKRRRDKSGLLSTYYLPLESPGEIREREEAMENLRKQTEISRKIDIARAFRSIKMRRSIEDEE